MGAGIKSLHHVSLLVDDTARALAFYCDVLGLDPDGARPDLGYPGAWLRIGNKQIHLLQLPNSDALAERPRHGGRDRHVAMTVENVSAIASLLEQAGIAYSRSASGRNALFCRDPDGNALEFIEG